MDGLNTRINPPQTTVGQLLLGGLAVVVSVEDNAPVLLQSFAGNVLGGLASINAVGRTPRTFQR